MPTPPHAQDDITVIMSAAAEGDREAAARLLPLVYEQLRSAAQQHMGQERDGHTLSATALVHEAFVKLAGPRQIPWAGRPHFYAAAAQAMRQILIDHARQRAASEGSRLRWEEIRDAATLVTADSDQILAVDAAVARLETEDPEAADVIRLRFYAGLTVEQAAEALDISPRTVARLWAYSRARLFRELAQTS